MSIFFFFYYYGRVSNLEYYTGERESEIVLGYLDIHTTAIHFLWDELNCDFLSHVRADDDSTCDACLLVTLNSLFLSF